MFLLNHKWRLWLDNTAAFITPATFFLLRTLVVHPVILGALVLLLMSRGNVGNGLLIAADELVWEAPAGQVWTCERLVIPDSIQHVYQAGAAKCNRLAIPGSVWAGEVNRSLALLYKSGVLMSLIASVVTWLIRCRASAR